LIPRTKAEREERYASLHRVLLNLQVTDAAGHAVEGLAAQDFTLNINHRPQKITLFRAVQEGGATAKAHAFLVIDMLNNSARDLGFARREIEKLLRSAKGPLPVPTSLATLTDNGIEAGNASRNGGELAAELAQMPRDAHAEDCTDDWKNSALDIKTTIISPEDATARNKEVAAERMGDCLNNKFQLSLLALRNFAHHQQDVPGRAIVIWIGPGWPVLSGPEFVPDTPHTRESDFENVVMLSTELREGQVTLDAVSWPVTSPVARLDPADWETLMRGTPTAGQASARSLAMPVLAHMSGGQVHLNQKTLTAALSACLADADAYYLVGFDSVPAAQGDEFRTIELTVDKPGVTARAVTAYYAQP
jgi:VWFA-related protein